MTCGRNAAGRIGKRSLGRRVQERQFIVESTIHVAPALFPFRSRGVTPYGSSLFPFFFQKRVSILGGFLGLLRHQTIFFASVSRSYSSHLVFSIYLLHIAYSVSPPDPHRSKTPDFLDHCLFDPPPPPPLSSFGIQIEGHSGCLGA